MINPGLSCGRCEWCRAGEQPLCPDFQVLGEHRDGTIAELVVVPERNLAPVPAGMSWHQAAAFPLATLTAWRMLTTRARLAAGERILIWGIGGGVALAALGIARHPRSALVTSLPAKLAWAGSGRRRDPQSRHPGRGPGGENPHFAALRPRRGRQRR
jgi:NADPH:quinone reductase-like Zn-dependent oxidoreductase